MILIDLSQIMMASTMMSMEHGQTEADLGFIRHSVLNSLRMYRNKYHEEFGELVICCDGRHSWRRDYFPLYKAGRKSGRDSSPLNWSQIFGCFETLKSELKYTFPYKFVEIDRAEADDIIGAVTRIETTEPIMIISGDKDFIQLQVNKKVKQYSPITKKFINGFDPDQYLKEHIMRGDGSDGIPNFMSPDNSIVDGIRQKPITKKKVAAWIDQEPEDFCTEEQLRNYHRNRKLIDLKETPRDIETEILDQYSRDIEGDRKNLLNFFIEKKLTNLIENIGDF